MKLKQDYQILSEISNPVPREIENKRGGQIVPLGISRIIILVFGMNQLGERVTQRTKHQPINL